MAVTILAGDVGGTKTNLALYAADGGGLTLVGEASFSSADHAGLDSLLRAFLSTAREPIAAAAFGVAGPVFGGVVVPTNLPWRVDAAHLAAAIGCPRVRLVNDLEATAYGALFLPPDQIDTVNAGRSRAGNRAVIAAGTGLGQALLVWDGRRHAPHATEGGHADFAPRTEVEIELLRFLAARYRRVTYERVLSGPGLVNIFRFFDEGLGRPVHPEVRERLGRQNPGAVIGEAGVTGLCGTCAEVVDVFLRIYGAQAGNLALTVMATGGVYVGGGIITKLRPRLAPSGFLDAYRAKEPYAELVGDIPLHIMLNPKAAQLGAAHLARELLG
jgi:glucokinase